MLVEYTGHCLQHGLPRSLPEFAPQAFVLQRQLYPEKGFRLKNLSPRSRLTNYSLDSKLDLHIIQVLRNTTPT